jgi:hypothetical protein
MLDVRLTLQKVTSKYQTAEYKENRATSILNVQRLSSRPCLNDNFWDPSEFTPAGALETNSIPLFRIIEQMSKIKKLRSYLGSN